jgi:DNA-directed RNA polymerase sigma subunit (sigma70/sigma32)
MTAFAETFPDILEQEAAFDSPPEERRGTTDLAGGLYRYRRAAERLQEYHTGSTEVFLSSAEEQELATVIQASLIAQEGIDRAVTTNPERAESLRQQYGHLLESGKAAEHKLVETNLRLAGFFARASMNIVPPKKKSGAAAQNNDIDPMSDETSDVDRQTRGGGDK